jgi:hypothetical protein
VCEEVNFACEEINFACEEVNIACEEVNKVYEEVNFVCKDVIMAFKDDSGQTNTFHSPSGGSIFSACMGNFEHEEAICILNDTKLPKACCLNQVFAM